MNKDKKHSKLVPELRFSEFEKDNSKDSYRKYLFTDIFIFSTGKNIKQSEASPEFEIPCVRYGELYHMYNEVIYEIINKTNLDKSELRFSKGNEILLPSAGEDPLDIGSASALTIESVAIGRTINILSPIKEKVYSQIYVSYYINQKFRRKISTLAKGSSISNVYNSDLKKLELLLPSLSEQQKIANTLSTLDHHIAAQNEKLDALKAHKKGLLQQLFPAKGEQVPKVRFGEFGGEWEECILGGIAEFSKGKGVSKKDIVSDGKHLCIRYGELYTGYSEVIDKVISRTNLPVTELVLSKGNDVIIPSSGETQIDIARASCVLREGIALGGDLNIIRSKINGVFFSYYLNGSKKGEIAQMAQGVSVMHLYNSQLEKLVIEIPHPKEQQKIANTLSSLDGLIAAQSEKIAALQSHKKGLMQGLFPNLKN